MAVLVCLAPVLPVTAQSATPNGNARLRTVGVIALAGAPVFDQAIFADGNVYISHAGTHSVDVFSPSKRRVIGHIVNLNDPRGIAADPASKTIYVADAGKKNIAVVNQSDLKIARTIAVSLVPDNLELAVQNKSIYASAVSTSEIARVPLDGGKPTVVDVGGQVGGLVYDPGSNHIFASINNTNEVVAINASGDELKVVQRWKLNASQPTGVAFDSRNGRLFVAVRFAVISLNVNTGQEISRVPAAAGTNTLHYEDMEHLLYAGATDGTVTVIEAGKGTLVASQEAHSGIKGNSLVVDPASHMVYMPGGSEGKSKLVMLRPYTMKLSDDEDEDPEPAAKRSEPRSEVAPTSNTKTPR